MNSLIFLILMLLIKYFNRSLVLQKELQNQREYFIKTLGHDLRVSAIAQIRALDLLEKNSCESVNFELVKEVSKACKYSLEMITMLLNTYKFESGEQVLNYEYFNFNDSISLCGKNLSATLKEKGLNLVYFNNGKSIVEADKAAVERLIEILLSIVILNSNLNSNIKIFTRTNASDFVVEIEYQGKALTEEEALRMLGKNSRFSTVGHGIKMNLCRKIVEFHDGRLGFSCKNDRNIFTIIIPVGKKNRQVKPIYFTRLQAKSL